MSSSIAQRGRPEKTPKVKKKNDRPQAPSYTNSRAPPSPPRQNALGKSAVEAQLRKHVTGPQPSTNDSGYSQLLYMFGVIPPAGEQGGYLSLCRALSFTFIRGATHKLCAYCSPCAQRYAEATCHLKPILHVPCVSLTEYSCPYRQCVQVATKKIAPRRLLGHLSFSPHDNFFLL